MEHSCLLFWQKFFLLNSDTYLQGLQLDLGDKRERCLKVCLRHFNCFSFPSLVLSEIQMDAKGFKEICCLSLMQMHCW